MCEPCAWSRMRDQPSRVAAGPARYVDGSAARSGMGRGGGVVCPPRASRRVSR